MRNILIKIKENIKFDQKGMTLVELLVVLSIFSVITSMVMFDYGNFKSTTSTQNLANDIALSIRKAQSSAIGVRRVGTSFDYGHGIHFTTSTDKTNPTSGSNKSFILFTDISNNNRYNYDSSVNCGNPSSGKECEEILNINGVDEISAIYLGEVKKDGGVLDIVFKRPDPDAIFCYRNSISDSSCLSASNVTIEVKNSQDPEDIIIRRITVWNTGQISVN